MNTMNTTDSTQSNAPEPQGKAPKGWVRWSGLMWFALIFALVFTLIYWIGTWALKDQLEDYASKAWGAKVEIGDVDIGVAPIRLGLDDLQVTDPDKPMENLLELARISASLNLFHLVEGRTVIEELVLTELGLHQPRKTSGALEDTTPVTTEAAIRKSASEPSDKGFAMPDMALPDPQAILARESLQTMEKAKEIEQGIQDLKQAWSNVQKELPSSDGIDQYQAQFEQLSQAKVSSPADIQKRLAEFQTLKKELESKRETLKKARDLLRERLPKLKADLAELKAMPQQDLNRLMSKYSLDGQGLSNVTYLLFGPQIRQYTQTALDWYQKAQPFLARLTQMLEEREAQAAEAKPERLLGRVVDFPLKDPQPEFIIKRITASANIDWGRVVAQVKQVTFDHPTTKLPVTFEVAATPASQSSALKITGTSSFVNPDSPVNQAQFDWPGYELSDWQLAKDDTLPVVMKKALATVHGKVSLTGMTDLDAAISLAYDQVDFDLSQTQSKQVARYIAPLFEKVSAFTVDTDIEGSVFAPSLSAKSDLDRVLSGAFKQVFQQEMAQAKGQLKEQLQAKMQGQLGPLQDQLGGLLDSQSAVNGDFQDVESIMQANLEKQLQGQLKQGAQKAIEDKVGDQLKGLFGR
ncbi:TIGR03545 family protein [Thiomicrospira sp. WB1]|uniref:TIGR03545 family protein n=1 Tax=Thiomicrospira sp. WB1 TaxID=1685380 RepID=UPI0009ECAFCB|nr:TIGR03545 family protein [Thiomicrospira sp. WB1]